MTAKARLEADRAELARFVDATFRYADDGTDAVLRTFAEGSNQVLGTVRVPLNGAGLNPIIEHAAHQATKAANAARPAVFAPPVATFVGSRACERDLGNGLVLTVDADQAPAIARRNLQFVLGPPTVVVASGSHWTDPETGEVEDKLHLHWRCREPTRSGAEHATLKQARALACAFVGGDASAISLVHPLRWPGSWHRKDDPRLARIVDLRPDVEIGPSEVVELLEPLIPVQRAGGRRRGRSLHDSVLDDHDLVSPVSSVARARDGFRNNIRRNGVERNVDARVNFSESPGATGDTGDTAESKPAKHPFQTSPNHQTNRRSPPSRALMAAPRGWRLR